MGSRSWRSSALRRGPVTAQRGTARPQPGNGVGSWDRRKCRLLGETLDDTDARLPADALDARALREDAEYLGPGAGVGVPSALHERREELLHRGCLGGGARRRCSLRADLRHARFEVRALPAELIGLLRDRSRREGVADRRVEEARLACLELREPASDLRSQARVRVVSTSSLRAREEAPLFSLRGLSLTLSAPFQKYGRAIALWGGRSGARSGRRIRGRTYETGYLDCPGDG